MYIILHKEYSHSSWKAQSKLFDCPEKAKAHCDAERDRTKGEQFRYVYIGDPDLWCK